MKRFLPILALLALTGCGGDQPVKRITYHSPEMDCEWLRAEHDRIHRLPAADPPPVTGKGILLTGAMILTAPLAIIQGLGQEKVEYAFSNDVNDLEHAARSKGCTTLLEEIEERRRAIHAQQ